MIDIKKHILHHKQPISTALKMMNELSVDLTLFIINDNEQLLGTVTDGDVRRGLLNGLGISDSVTAYMNANFRFILKDNYKVKEIARAKELGIQILPVVDEQKHIIRLINF